MPTINSMPKNSLSITLSFSSLMGFEKLVFSLFGLSSSICVAPRQSNDNKDTAAKIRKVNSQSPNCFTIMLAIIGPRKDDIAFINCPKVSVLASLS